MLLRREKVELRCWGENNLARFDLNVNDTWYFLCCYRCHATPHDCCYLLLVYFNHLTTFNECAHRCLNPNRSSPVKIIRVRRYNIHLSISESQMESETLSHRWTELISRNFQRISLCCVWLQASLSIALWFWLAYHVQCALSFSIIATDNIFLSQNFSDTISHSLCANYFQITGYIGEEIINFEFMTLYESSGIGCHDDAEKSIKLERADAITESRENVQ